MKQVIISGLLFLFLSGAVASIAAVQEVIKPEALTAKEPAALFQLAPLKSAFKYGLTTGWQVTKADQ